MLAAITWFATADIRTSKAISFDEETRSALNGNDINNAYQKAEFAYALSPSDDRAITLGSLAYVRRQYQASKKYFHTTATSGSSLAEQAKVGELAAAAEIENESDFNQTIKQAGSPANNLKLAFANALINGGGLDTAGSVLAKDKVSNQNIAYAKSIGQAPNNLAGAQTTQEEAGSGFDKPAFTNPAYERFIRELITVPKNGNRDLSTAFSQMAIVTDSASRNVILASTLYRLNEYRAAESLAETAVHQQPAYRDGWSVLAAAQISLKNYSKAEQSLKVSTDLDKGYGYTWYLKSQLAKQQNQTKKADEYAEQAKQLGYKK